MDILKIILYLPSIIFTVISIMIIFIIFKYRKNPYIKSYSPLLCNLVIISFIMEMHSPYLMIHYKTIEICYFFDIYHTISTNLMLLPVIAITYRIYTIYNNKSKINFGQKLNNKNLFIFVFSTLLVMTLFSIYINLNREYYILSYGNIETFRNPSCITDDRKYSIIEFIIYRIMFLCIAIMIIKTGSISKQYGQFKFIYVLVIIFIVDWTVWTILPEIPYKGYFVFYILLLTSFMITYAISIYYLVGSKLLYIFNHSMELDSLNSGDDHNKAANLSYFVPELKNEINNINAKSSQRASNRISSDLTFSEDEIDNNPNNLFFNISLQMINKSNSS
eukprot:jgi/Orpsp1_1/1187647/evm.model.d7180000059197.1